MATTLSGRVTVRSEPHLCHGRQSTSHIPGPTTAISGLESTTNISAHSVTTVPQRVGRLSHAQSASQSASRMGTKLDYVASDLTRMGVSAKSAARQVAVA